jgi:hypothetical protein
VKTLLPFVIGCLAATACVKKDDLIVWKAEATSPDGKWLASADTVQNGGFGSAHVDTSVYLKRTGSSQPPREVLVFTCHGVVPHPYVLDNAANHGGTIDLTMTWVTPTHLHVTYGAHPDIDLQIVKYAGVEITAQDLSGSGKGIPSPGQ